MYPQPPQLGGFVLDGTCDLACHDSTEHVNAERARGGMQCHAMLVRASAAEAVRGAARMAEHG